VPIHDFRPAKAQCRVVQRIVADIGVPRDRCLYVGDSLRRDVGMAGAPACWPRGLAAAITIPVRGKLDLISTAGGRCRPGRPPGGGGACADVVALTSFDDLLKHFQFGPPDHLDGVSARG
jgi:hypothetical protein